MSQSAIMTFKKYVMPIVSQELYLSDTSNWGWFVDTDTYNNPFKNANELKYKKYSKKVSMHLDIPSTIYEFPSIRSMKSITNLEDMTSMYNNEDIFTKQSADIYNSDIYNDDADTCTAIVWSTLLIGIYYIISL
jgi:hypothetical protein